MAKQTVSLKAAKIQPSRKKSKGIGKKSILLCSFFSLPLAFLCFPLVKTLINSADYIIISANHIITSTNHIIITGD